MPFRRTFSAPPVDQPDPSCVCDGTGLRDPNHPGEGWCPLCGRGAILRARTKAQIPAAASRTLPPASNGRNAAVANTTARAAVGGRDSETTDAKETA